MIEFLAPVTVAGVFAFKFIGDILELKERERIRNIEPVYDPQVQLVVELLKSDSGWDFDGGKPYYLLHDTGIRIWVANEDYGLSYTVKGDDGIYRESVELSPADKRHIWHYVKVLHEKRERERSRALTAALAARVAEREERRLAGLLDEPRLGISGPNGDSSVGLTAALEYRNALEGTAFVASANVSKFHY